MSLHRMGAGVFPLCIAVVVGSPSIGVAQGSLQGSIEAVAAAERLVEAVGGHGVWAAARSLYVRERVWSPRYAGEFDARYWRDLERPAHHSRLDGASLRREAAWNAETGWIQRNDSLRSLSAAEVATEVAGWAQEPYRIYSRLALRDPGLRVELVDGDRLEILDAATGHQLCWFVLDHGGGPLRWGNLFNGAVNEHVYGPLRTFGDFNMPAWGTSVDGSWRFEYVEVRGSPEEFRIPAGPQG